MDYMELVQVRDFLLHSIVGACAGSCLHFDFDLQKHVDDNADITLSCAPVGERYVIVLHQVFNFSSTSFSSQIVAPADFIFFVFEAVLPTMDLLSSTVLDV